MRSRGLVLLVALLALSTSVQAATLEITPTAPTVGAFDIANLVGSANDADNVGTGENPPYTNDATTYVAHDRGGQGQTFLTGAGTTQITGVWVQHVSYTTSVDQTWYQMQVGSQLQIRITNPAASGGANFVLASEIYTITGQEQNALPTSSTNTQTGTGRWFHVTLDKPVTLEANTLYGFDLTSLSGQAGVFFFETMGLRDDAAGGNPYANGTAYVTGSAGAPDNTMTVAPGDRVFIVELNSPYVAHSAVPANTATEVLRTADLSWTAGDGITLHDVYLGTNSSDVSAATRAQPLGVLVSQGQSNTTFDPGALQFGQTYYWRIDEVEQNGTIHRGNVWSFTVEAMAYALTGITATASSVNSATNTPAINTVNDSGMTGDLADTNNKAMWQSAKGTFPAWIQFDFDGLYKLYEMKVWNHNSPYESVLGFGAKDTVVEYSTDGTTWTKLGDFQFAQAAGEEAQAVNTIVPFSGVAARSVKITINNTWLSLNQTGLSEVRFYYLPVVAREPSPATDSTGVNPTTVALGWRPGREAATHNVYLGTDANALTLAGSPTTADFTPANIVLGAKYYWRVDEVNTAAAPTTWASAVWNFTTSDFLVVDDMEGYNDTTNAIYSAWIDGYNTGTNGAQVGHNSPTNSTFGETSIIYGGKQSMPLIYGNSNIATSEATRTFTTDQDWSRAGITTLTLFFRGASTNTSSQLYVKINGTQVTYPGNASILSALVWKQWNIDLSAVGNVKAVKTLTIGLTGTGTGTLYIDDIRLYRSAPAMVTPADPGTNNLVASYAMESDAKDSKGGYNGTLNTITFSDSVTTALGKAAVFNGTSGYIDLGATFGTGVVSKLTNCTATAWVYYAGSGNNWQRVFDFGTSSTNYMFLTTRNGNSYPRFAVRGTGKDEVSATDTKVMSVGWHHTAAVVDAATMTIALYVDGILVQGSVTTTVTPKDLGATTQNWLGRSMFSTDPYLTGTVDELKIFNRVLTAGEIAYLAGER